MVTLILSLLDTGLKLWLSKEKTKYIDKRIALEKQWYAEYSKPETERSQAILDNILFELKVLVIAFTQEASK